MSEALLFPGQGLSPKDIIGFYSKLDNLDPHITERSISQAQEALNLVHGTKEFDIRQTLKDGSSPNYGKTAFIQPVIYALSVTAYELFKDKLSPELVAGYSLGELAAITASGVITPEQGYEMVSYRGLCMQNAGDRNESRLVSLQGIGVEKVIKIFESGKSEIALINSPEFIVLGCRELDVPLINELAEAAGVQKIVNLDLRAFHTSLMQEAKDELEPIFARYQLGKVQIPVVANISGELVEAGIIYPVDNLLDSLIHTVQWAKSMDTLKNRGVDRFIAMSSDNSLQSLARRNGVSKEQTMSILI